MIKEVRQRSRIALFFVLALALVLSVGAAKPTLAQGEESVTISLWDAQTRVVGSATFTQMDEGVMIEMTVNGMLPEPGDRAVMIHEVGMCEPPDFLDTVGPAIYHLPPAQFYSNGGTTYKAVTDEFTLAELMDDDGSSLDIHADVPPQAGPIIICGEIPAGSGAPTEPAPMPTEPEPAPAPEPTEPEPAPAPAPAPMPPAPEPAPVPPTTGACPSSLEEALEGGAGAFLIDAQGRDVGLALMIEDSNCVVGVEILVGGMQPVPGNHRATITEAAYCDAPDFSTAGADLWELPPVQFFSAGNADYFTATDAFVIDDLFDADGTSVVLYADESPDSDRILCGQVIPLPTFLDAIGLTVGDLVEALG